MLSKYEEDLSKLDEPIVWEAVKEKEMTRIETSLNGQASIQEPVEKVQDPKPFTVVALGDCGQGKSTSLSDIAKIYHKIFDPKGQAIEFARKQSYESVTSCVEIATIGGMTLIDTPGFNDPKSLRSGKKILNELTKIIRPRLRDET